MYKDIEEFHIRFGLNYDGKPRELNEKLQQFRIKFLEEELEEYKRAVIENNLHDAFDALIDLVYVTLGTAHLHGFDFIEGWKRVHKANMKKIRVEYKSQSKRNSLHDVIKPKDWEHPNLDDLL